MSEVNNEAPSVGAAAVEVEWFCITCCQPLNEYKWNLTSLSNSTKRKSFPGSDGSKVVNSLLRLYFIARKLLKLPKDRCLRIVESSCLGMTSEGAYHQCAFKMCENCECIVDGAIDSHHHILRLQREIETLGGTLSDIVDANKSSCFDAAPKSFKILRNLICPTSKRSKIPPEPPVQIKTEPTIDFSDMDTELERFFAGDDNGNDFQEPSPENLHSGDEDMSEGETPSKRSSKRKRKRPSAPDFDYAPGRKSVKPRTPKKKSSTLIEARSKRIELTGKYADIVIDRKNSKFSCKFCSTVYSSGSAFKRHLLAHETSDRMGNIFDCPQCKHPNLSEEKLRRHIGMTHEENKNTCHICGYVGSRRWLHEKHMLDVHNIRVWTPISADGDSAKTDAGTSNDPLRKFCCDRCGSVYFSYGGFKRHLNVHKESDRTGNKFDCSICRHPTLSDSKLLQHMTKCHDQVPPDGDTKVGLLLGEKETGANLGDSAPKDDSVTKTKTFKCKRCNSVYITQKGFARHMRLHKASAYFGGQFDCPICRYPCRSEAKLSMHVAAAHKGNTVSTITFAKDGVVEESVSGPLASTEVQQKDPSHPSEEANLKGGSKRSTAKESDLEDGWDDDDFDDDDDEGKTDAESVGRKGRNSADESSEASGEDYDDDDDDEFSDASSKKGSSSGRSVCKKCKVVYRSKRAFRNHQEEHKASDAMNHKFDCSKCGFPCSSEQKLRFHRKRVHNETFKHTCKICGYKCLRLNQFQRHVKTHDPHAERRKPGRPQKWKPLRKNDGQLQCMLCSSTYRTPKGLRNHTLQHRKSEEQGGKFACDLCKFPCLDEAGLKQHHRVVHTEKNTKCDICDRTFRRAHMLKEHMQVHARYDKLKDEDGLYQCPICSYKSTLHGFLIHKNFKHAGEKLEGDDTTSHLCNQCGLSFTTPATLKIHIKNKHEHIFRYNCEICGKGFEAKPSFEGHMRTHEANRVREFVCNVCGTAYSHRKTLDDHMARFHPDQVKGNLAASLKAEKPGKYNCKWCQMVFPFKYLLVNHLPVAHKDEYKFPCDSCDKAYFTSSSLRLHKEIAHSNGDGTLHSCQYCGKTFIHKHYVICHYKFCTEKRKGASAAYASTSAGTGTAVTPVSASISHDQGELSQGRKSTEEVQDVKPSSFAASNASSSMGTYFPWNERMNS